MKPTQCLGVLTLRAGQYSTSVRFFFSSLRVPPVRDMAPCAAPKRPNLHLLVPKLFGRQKISRRCSTFPPTRYGGDQQPPRKKKVEIDTRACTELAIFHKVPSPVVNFLLCRTPFSVLQTDRKHLEEENDTIIRKCPLKRIFKASFSH